MNKSLRILKSNNNVIFSCSKYIFITLIFIYIYIYKLSNLHDSSTYLECIYILFYGPLNLSDNISELFIWSIQQFYLLSLIGNYLFKEISVRNIYTINRIGSIKKWLAYMQVSIFFTCIVYYLIGFIIEISGIFILHKSISLNDLINILEIFLILVLSSYFIYTMYYIVLLITKNHSLSFIIIVLCSYFSILFGDVFSIDKFLPINHGILSKHFFYNFSFKSSYIYLGILLIINIFIINTFTSKKDFIYQIN